MQSLEKTVDKLCRKIDNISTVKQKSQPIPHMMQKLNTCDTDINFLYDLGLQAIIMTKNVYDSLKSKQALRKINKSGTRVDRSIFKFDRIVDLDIKFPKSSIAETYTLEYEPVLVSLIKNRPCIYQVSKPSSTAVFAGLNTRGSVRCKRLCK